MEQNDRDLLLAIGRLEGKVDALIANSAVQSEEIHHHDSRLRTLETSRSALVGAVAIISAAVSAGIAWFTR